MVSLLLTFFLQVIGKVFIVLLSQYWKCHLVHSHLQLAQFEICLKQVGQFHASTHLRLLLVVIDFDLFFILVIIDWDLHVLDLLHSKIDVGSFDISLLWADYFAISALHAAEVEIVCNMVSFVWKVRRPHCKSILFKKEVSLLAEDGVRLEFVMEQLNLTKLLDNLYIC